MRIRALGSIMLAAICFCTPALAGNLHSKYGATATVGSRFVSQFQGLINDLEVQGARITFMGGIRRGACGQASKHPCGMALDVCQLSRGVVAGKCHLPGRQSVSAIARRHNLFSGGDWCDSDYGHFEAGGSVACGHSWASNEGHHHAKTIAYTRHRSSSYVASTGEFIRPDYH